MLVASAKIHRSGLRLPADYDRAKGNRDARWFMFSVLSASGDLEVSLGLEIAIASRMEPRQFEQEAASAEQKVLLP